MNLNPVIISIPVFFILIILELLYERYSGKHTYRLNDAVTNINLGTLDQVSGLFFKVIKIGIYTIIFEKLSLVHIPNNWISFIALFLLYDLCYYWSHRMAHEISLFWGGHVVHHQSEDYNLSVALRQSSTAFIWSVPFYLPLAILGFDPVQFVFVAGLNLLYQFWIHTEHIDRLPNWIEWVMNTPSHHRVHHARNPEYIDQNYAGVFIIWDRLFGTFTEEKERPTYGISKPLNSWNPIYANFAHYMDLYKAVRAARSLNDSMAILFKRPGWMPDYLGGFQKPTAIKRLSVQKYNVIPGNMLLRLYVFVQFTFLLILTALFLFNYSRLNQSETLFAAIWIIFSAMLIGKILEQSGKKSIQWGEYLRLGTWIAAVIYFFYIWNIGLVLTLILLGIITISLLVYYRITKRYISIKNNI